MMSVLFAEILTLGVLAFLGAFFYNEISWQKSKAISPKIVKPVSFADVMK